MAADEVATARFQLLRGHLHIEQVLAINIHIRIIITSRSRIDRSGLSHLPDAFEIIRREMKFQICFWTTVHGTVNGIVTGTVIGMGFVLPSE